MHELNLKPAHIVVVDDEPANLKLVTEVLKADGYFNVTPMCSAQDLIGFVTGVNVDLLLLDLNMPGINGFDVLKMLDKVGQASLPSVMVLTAQDGKQQRLKALELGALEFLSKPFDRVELLVRVRNMLHIQFYKNQLENQNHILEELVDQRTMALKDTQLKIVRRLGVAAEFRDNETGMHIVRMSKMSKLLAEEIGASKEMCDLILNASPMHDVGKIGIPDHILNKPGKLSESEWEIMQRHTLIGAEILSGDDSELLKTAHQIALYHHEKWDGSGYPYGLKGEDIPIEARICGVADVFDALTSERPYKRAWDVEDAKQLILESAGSHFDPELVSAFERLYGGFCELRREYQDDPMDMVEAV